MTEVAAAPYIFYVLLSSYTAFWPGEFCPVLTESWLIKCVALQKGQYIALLIEANEPAALRTFHFSLFALPLIPLQIYMAAVFQQNALLLQKAALFPPAGHKPARMIYHTMTGVFAIV